MNEVLGAEHRRSPVPLRKPYGYPLFGADNFLDDKVPDRVCDRVTAPVGSEVCPSRLSRASAAWLLTNAHDRAWGGRAPAAYDLLSLDPGRGRHNREEPAEKDERDQDCDGFPQLSPLSPGTVCGA
jgi:hypothetical protein